MARGVNKMVIKVHNTVLMRNFSLEFQAKGLDLYWFSERLVTIGSDVSYMSQPNEPIGC